MEIVHNLLPLTITTTTTSSNSVTSLQPPRSSAVIQPSTFENGSAPMPKYYQIDLRLYHGYFRLCVKVTFGNKESMEVQHEIMEVLAEALQLENIKPHSGDKNVKGLYMFKLLSFSLSFSVLYLLIHQPV